MSEKNPLDIRALHTLRILSASLDELKADRENAREVLAAHEFEIERLGDEANGLVQDAVRTGRLYHNTTRSRLAIISRRISFHELIVDGVTAGITDLDARIQNLQSPAKNAADAARRRGFSITNFVFETFIAVARRSGLFPTGTVR